jgi:thiol peroxidase
MIERAGGVTSKGRPLTVIGRQLKPGDTAPDFTLLGTDMNEVTLSDFQGKVRVISVVTSLDTGLCDLQTRRFNEEAAKLGDDVVIITVSADLPFAQKRWCGAAGVERVITLSDHRGMSFGDAYGTHVKELRLEQRAVLVVDGEGTVRYAQYVPEIAQHPDYEAALSAVKELTS